MTKPNASKFAKFLEYKKPKYIVFFLKIKKSYLLLGCLGGFFTTAATISVYITVVACKVCTYIHHFQNKTNWTENKILRGVEGKVEVRSKLVMMAIRLFSGSITRNQLKQMG